MSQEEIPDYLRMRLTITTVKTPPCILLTLADPAQVIAPGQATTIVGSVQAAIPKDEIDDIIALLQKKRDQLFELT